MYSDRVLESDEAKPLIDGMYGQYLLQGTPTLDSKVFNKMLYSLICLLKPCQARACASTVCPLSRHNIESISLVFHCISGKVGFIASLQSQQSLFDVTIYRASLQYINQDG